MMKFPLNCSFETYATHEVLHICSLHTLSVWKNPSSNISDWNTVLPKITNQPSLKNKTKQKERDLWFRRAAFFFLFFSLEIYFYTYCHNKRFAQVLFSSIVHYIGVKSGVLICAYWEEQSLRQCMCSPSVLMIAWENVLTVLCLMCGLRWRWRWQQPA